MKHFSLFIFLFSFLFAACSKEEHEQGTVQKSFSLSIEEPDFAPQSRATAGVSRYLLEMYEGDLNATPVKMNSPNGQFDVEVKKGVDYVCLFWADDDTSYNADNLKAVKQTSETARGTVAYCARVTVNSKSFNGAITLKRAVAELSFIDKNGLIETSNKLKIIYPYASAALNVGDGTVTRTTGIAIRTITGILPPTDKATAFATDFILAPTEAGQLKGLKFQLNAEEEKTIASLAVQANFRTKITGEYQVLLPSMSFTIDTRKNSASDATFILPLKGIFTGYDLRVDWGDGESKTFPGGTTLDQNNLKHVYTAGANVYTITITSTQKDPTQQQMPKLAFGQNYSSTNNNSEKLITLDSPLLNMGADFSHCFSSCRNLTSIPADLFAANAKATNFSYCFSSCRNLTSISADLFAANADATDFSKCFCDCEELTSIPEKLFAKNSLATDFSYCFRDCVNLTSIPEKLFEKNAAATSFNYCFGGCTVLGSIPEQLFAANADATDFSKCFCDCEELTSIPEKLFEKNIAATDFSSCFERCVKLAAIPTNLFTENSLAVKFDGCFYYCEELTEIPGTLFEKNIAAVKFDACFSDCTKLKEIPDTLFAANSKATDFSACFFNCTALTSIPATLFEHNTLATNFSHCFYNCKELTSIPATLFEKNTGAYSFSHCFYECKELTAVPELLFEKNIAATDFSRCFDGCTKLVLNANIFCNEEIDKDRRFAGKRMYFEYTFGGCGSDDSVIVRGTAPALWEYQVESFYLWGCFYDVTKVTNASAIPDEWK